MVGVVPAYWSLSIEDLLGGLGTSPSTLVGFVALLARLLIALIGVTLLYVVSVELNKAWFYARVRPM